MSTPDSNDAFGANSWLIEEMREAWEKDPSSVDESWRIFFAGDTSATGNTSTKPAASDSPPPQEHSRKK